MDFKFNVNIFKYLHPDAKMIRQTVFVDEQGFTEEWDEADNGALHVVLYDGDTPVATCRILPTDKSDEVILGRFAVVRACRGGGVGSRLMREVCEHLEGAGVSQITLHSQEQAVPFYEKNGFACFGERDFEEGCPHRWMKKSL